jgi:DNA-binding NtrC family response regulator
MIREIQRVREKCEVDKINVMVINQTEDDMEKVINLLDPNVWHISTSQSFTSAVKLLKNKKMDVVFIGDEKNVDTSFDILEYIKENFNDTEVVIISSISSIDAIIESIKKGAFYYIVKPVEASQINHLLIILHELISIKKDPLGFFRHIEVKSRIPVVLGESNEFKKVINLALNIANSKSTVLLSGETGTGKEIIASTIHNSSKRKSKPFLTLNCGAIPETLLEAELFGYEKGAFTGAANRKLGKIELANGGTLFLDEIGDLSLALQVKLLHVLQNGIFERLGGTKTIAVDVRFIAATNLDLKKMMEEKKFREDLYYRLNVIPIEIPPLRHRRKDIPHLVHHFIQKYNHLNDKHIRTVEPRVLKKMMVYSWKGNVRELENMVERAVVIAKGNILKVEHFPDLPIDMTKTEENGLIIPLGSSLENIEKAVIFRTLELNNFNKENTAKTLQIGTATLYRKLKKYRIGLV